MIFFFQLCVPPDLVSWLSLHSLPWLPILIGHIYSLLLNFGDFLKKSAPMPVSSRVLHMFSSNVSVISGSIPIVTLLNLLVHL